MTFHSLASVFSASNSFSS